MISFFKMVPCWLFLETDLEYAPQKYLEKL